jgi:5'-3' exonuclease
MCGTDYNKNIFKVGPEKAYRLIKEFGSIDKIEGYDISVLNHIRVREIFKDYQRLNTEIKYCEPPNFEKLNVFLFKNNIRMNVERIRKDFSLKEIIIVDDDS